MDHNNQNTSCRSKLDIFLYCCDGKLDQLNFDWDEKKSMCIVLCSNGYPDKYKKNVLIENISRIKTTEDDFCFHAGTNIIENKIFAIGGRVLNFVSLSENFSEARKKIISKLIKSKYDFVLPSNQNWKGNWKLRYKNPINDLETFKVNSS